jgi:hypothetical protein
MATLRQARGHPAAGIDSSPLWQERDLWMMDLSGRLANRPDTLSWRDGRVTADWSYPAMSRLTQFYMVADNQGSTRHLCSFFRTTMVMSGIASDLNLAVVVFYLSACVAARDLAFIDRCLDPRRY